MNQTGVRSTDSRRQARKKRLSRTPGGVIMRAILLRLS
jgi:hypothetical protein